VFDPTYTGLDWEFESYLVALEELKQGQLRLLDVTEALYLPVFDNIRLLITSSDVLHS
jgi:heme/copper-type cytochrome/quinol oxidase subunit 2